MTVVILQFVSVCVEVCFLLHFSVSVVSFFPLIVDVCSHDFQFVTRIWLINNKKSSRKKTQQLSLKSHLKCVLCFPFPAIRKLWYLFIIILTDIICLLHLKERLYQRDIQPHTYKKIKTARLKKEKDKQTTKRSQKQHSNTNTPKTCVIPGALEV